MPKRFGSVFPDPSYRTEASVFGKFGSVVHCRQQHQQHGQRVVR